MRMRFRLTFGALVLLLPVATAAFAQGRANDRLQNAPPVNGTAAGTATPRPEASVLLRVDPGLQTEEVRRLARIAATDRAKLLGAGRLLFTRMEQPPPRGVRPKSIEEHARDVAVALNIAGADIEALAILVMMQAAKDAREDLRSAMAKVKALELMKPCKTADCLAALKPTAEVDQATLDATRNEMKNKLDSMSEMSETQAMRMQMYMDRVSKFMSTLSNLLKKASDTAAQTTQNLK